MGVSSGPAGGSSSGTSLSAARHELLVLSDFPKGWTTSASGNGSGGVSKNLGDAQIAQCLGVSTSLIEYNPPNVSSPEFDYKRFDWSVTEDLNVFPNSRVASEQFDLYAETRTPACFARAFNSPSVKQALVKSIGSGVTIGTVAAGKYPTPYKGSSAGVVVVIPIKGPTSTIDLIFVQVVIRYHLAAAQLQLTSTAAIPFSASLARRLEGTVASRLG